MHGGECQTCRLHDVQKVRDVRLALMHPVREQTTRVSYYESFERLLDNNRAICSCS